MPRTPPTSRWRLPSSKPRLTGTSGSCANCCPELDLKSVCSTNDVLLSAPAPPRRDGARPGRVGRADVDRMTVALEPRAEYDQRIAHWTEVIAQGERRHLLI